MPAHQQLGVDLKIIDVHAYPGTHPWFDSQGPYPAALTDYWGHEWKPKEEADVVADFRAAGVQPVILANDIETACGAPPCTNEYVAGLRAAHPDVILQCWASVDPWKGQIAIDQAERAVKELGLLGFHFHPIIGRFSVDDPRHRPLFEAIAGLGAPVMVDVGTTGMGAGMPGGDGAILRNAHPMAIDELAATFPGLKIIAAHPGWPWIDEMTAVALHKANVYWELSGWAPKYFPDSLVRDIRGRLRHKIMFGSDYPSMPYERVLREWQEIGLSDDVSSAVFHANAERILGF
jgi:predicted TIM-barrel fold metal-dependent hydrolase